MVKHKGMNRQGMVRLLAAGIMAGTLIVLVTTNSGAAKKKSITFTMANYGQLSNSPNDYKGAHVNISGKVFSLPPTGTKGISAVQMWMGTRKQQLEYPRRVSDNAASASSGRLPSCHRNWARIL